jgi:D-alanine-D-alanine ligase
MALKPGGFIPVVHAATRERPDEIDTLVSAEAVARALGELGFATEIVAVDLDLNHFLALKRRDPLLVFNLVDAVRGDGRLAPIIPSLLDAVGLPYTGAHSDAWLETLSKVATKLKFAREGLPTPGFSVDGAGLDPDAKVIVKAVWEHGSLGLDEGSVVKGADAARVIADRVARFGTEHFAERFVEGREFNLSLLEERGRATVLPIAEILFEDWRQGRPRIVGYDAKWTSDSEAYVGTPRRFGLEKDEPALAAELEKLAKSCWELFNLAGYARVDFRVGREGRPTILEVNVNPCLNPDAGFAAAAAQGGLSYRDLIGGIIDAAPRALPAIA